MLIEPRSAYVHVPFCARRCGYCNFTLVAGREDLIDHYLDAIEIELRQLQKPIELDTLFWGGGTPTMLSAPQLERLVALMYEWLPVVKNGEWSVESNPLDCSTDKLQLLSQAGVNRLSIGAQSFNDRKLEVLERDHRQSDLLKAIETAHAIFDNIAIDLIFAAPGESAEDWLADLNMAIAQAPHHISTYGLTIERGSAFYGRTLRGELSAIEEEVELSMYTRAIEVLTAVGMQHYEVSNFAMPGKECGHNQAYWLGKPWLAFGPGAAAFNGVERTVNHRSTTTYIRRVLAGESPIAERDALTPEQQIRERFVFGLRQLAGIDLSDLGTPDVESALELFEPHLSEAIAAGWLERSGNRVRLTRSGLVISDSLWPNFLGDT